MAGSGENILVGALVGYVASRTMDVATTWFYERQSEQSKLKEDELAPGGALVQVGMMIGSAAGREYSREEAGEVGLRAHRTLGVIYGMIASALVRRGVPPLAAGLAVGAGALLVVDEGTAITQMTDYPLESHLRGVIGHSTLGATIGTLLALVDRRG